MEVTPVPPPATTAVVNEGLAEAPPDTSGMPDVAEGAIRPMVAVPAPTRTLWFVSPVSWIVSVLADPTAVMLPVPKILKFPDEGDSAPPSYP